MRIFCAVRHSLDSHLYYGGLWSGNFYPALRELGHQIVESKTDLLPTSRFMNIAEGFTPNERQVRASTTERILDEVRAANSQEGLDLFLSYFYNSHFDPTGFDELRRMGIPSVNFYCNSMHQFANVAAIAAKADYSWYAERDARSKYLDVGANPVWVQMGADPTVYRPRSVGSRQPKSCFIGQRYCDRDRLLAALVRAEVPVAIYGSGWSGDESPRQKLSACQDNLGRKTHRNGGLSSYLHVAASHLCRDGILAGSARVVRQAMYRRESKANRWLLRPFIQGRAKNVAEVFSQFEVCLNFSNVWSDGLPGSKLIPHVRLRDFEGPMCRTCYLTGHTDEITEFYEVGKEIDTYQSDDELVDKTRFYLANPKAAEKVREAGYQRATRDHNWKRRFDQLFEKIGLLNACGQGM